MEDVDAAYCNSLGKFVAYLRARPSKKQAEDAHRELSTRLCIQLTKLAYSLAVVLNKQVIDAEVMARVRQVAFDSAKGRTLTLLRRMHLRGTVGENLGGLVAHTGHDRREEEALLKFLRRIKAVERYTLKNCQQWRLSPRLVRLWKEVHGAESTP